MERLAGLEIVIFFFFVTNVSFQIRKPLKQEVERQRRLQTGRRKPEMTTKGGKLKEGRKAKLTQMFMDDLVSLENFTVVR